MDLYYSNISDETLFLKMTQGDLNAQAILLHRYEHAGFQCLNVLSRKYSFYAFEDNDFIDVIDAAIYKSFRYYRLNERKFGPFCFDILNQSISQRLGEMISDNLKLGEILYLDAPLISDNNTYFHEIIPDHYHLSAPEEYNLKDLINTILNESDKKTIKELEMYEYSLYGLTIKEIARKLNKSTYEVRVGLANARKLMDEKLNEYKLT